MLPSTLTLFSELSNRLGLMTIRDHCCQFLDSFCPTPYFKSTQNKSRLPKISSAPNELLKPTVCTGSSIGRALGRQSESKLTSAELLMLIGDLLGFTKIHMKYKNKYIHKYKKYIREQIQRAS